MKFIKSARLPTAWSPGALISAGLIALTILAFGVRVFGARSSIAYIPDTQIVRQALDLGQSLASVRSFDINLVSEIKYPQTLPLYLLGVYGLIFAGGYVAGFFSNLTDFTVFLFTQRETVHFISIIALGGLAALATPLAFKAARTLEPSHTGWLAAGLVAFDLILVHFSHQARPHAALATVTLIAVITLARALTHHRWYDTVLATLACALTIGVLQSGVLILIPFGLFWLIRLYDARSQSALKQTLGSLLVNLVLLVGVSTLLYPPLLTDFINLVSALVSGEKHLSFAGGAHSIRTRTFGFDRIPRFGVRFFSYQPFAAALFLPAVSHLIWTQRLQWRRLIVVLSFPLASLMVWSTFFGAARYWTSLSLFSDILCAYLVEGLCLYLFQRWRVSLWLSRCLLFSALLVPSFIQAVRLDYVLAQPDTRTQASEWIEQHAPNNAAVIANFQLLELIPNKASLRRQDQDYPGTLGTYYQWLLQQPAKAYPAGPNFDIVDQTWYWPDDPDQQHQVAQQLNLEYALVQTTATNFTSDNRLFEYAQRYGQPVAVFCPGAIWEGNYLPTDIFAPAWLEIWEVHNPGPIVVVYELNPQPQTSPPQLSCP